MWQWFISGFVALSFLTGLGNYVSALIYRVLGTSPVTYQDGVGIMRTTILGPAAPQPGWVPRPEGSLIVTASRNTELVSGRQAGGMHLATRMSKDQLSRFFKERLQTEGFVVTAEDSDIIHPTTARALGYEGMVHASHPEKGWHFRLTIATPSGFVLQSRMVGLLWWDWPFEPPALPPGLPAQRQ